MFRQSCKDEKLGIISSGATHIGRKRKSNQDAIYLSSQDNLYIVADGVGGHNGGDVASNMAVRLIPEYFFNQKIDKSNVKYHLQESIQYANKAIFDQAIKRPELKGMGTTVVGLYFLEENLYIINVGDSRAYLFRDDELYPLTRDHSFIQEKVNLGIYTREQAMKDPMKNILVRIVGYEESINVDIFVYKVSVHDFFLLCSDGLHGQVRSQDILSLMSQNLSPHKECSQSQVKNAVHYLVDQANQNGGNDNISVIISKAQ